MRGPKISVVDHGVGNIKSVMNALNYCGYDAITVNDPKGIDSSQLLILPGVGNFGAVMGAITSLNLYDPIKSALSQNKPFIGICVGMQALFDSSVESPEYKGFGFLSGKLDHLSALDSGPVTPSIGWNSLDYSRPSTELFSLQEAYFVHSYFASNVEDSNIVSTYNWSGHKIPAHVNSGNIHGFQFHPEKSRLPGVQFLDGLVQRIVT